jgi:hypothetical protein
LRAWQSAVQVPGDEQPTVRTPRSAEQVHGRLN